MKKMILFFLMWFIFEQCYALSYGGCDYSTVARMKAIVNNINISYDYKIVNDEAYFSVTLNNLTNDIYFYDNETEKTYYYSNTSNGEITINNYTSSGRYRFYSNNLNCKGIELGSKYYKFPEYNHFFSDPLCADIPNYTLCQKWVSVNYSRYEFEKMVEEYKSDNEDIVEEGTIIYEKTIVDKIVELYVNYYYYYLGGIIIILTPIIIIYNRKNRFKL